MPYLGLFGAWKRLVLLMKRPVGGSQVGPKGPKMGQWYIPCKHWPFDPLCGVWNQIWCHTRLPEGTKEPVGGIGDPSWPPPGPPKPCPDPPNWSVITPYDVQWPKNFNPPKNGPKTARKWPKMRNRPKMGQKRIFSKSCNGPILKFWELTRTTKIKKMTLSFGMVLFFLLKASSRPMCVFATGELALPEAILSTF